MKNVAKVKAICYNNSNPSNTIMSLKEDVVDIISSFAKGLV